MRRREALRWMSAAVAGGAMSAYRFDFGETLKAQSRTDWAARIAELPRPEEGEIVLTAVGDMIISSPAADRKEESARQMYEVLRKSDVAFGNCEQAIASVGYLQPKAAVMGWPSILDDFQTAGFDLLALANNHYMDLGEEAALQGLDEIHRRGFTTGGGGKNLAEALAPGVREVKGLRVGLLAFWCAEDGFNPPGYMELARAGENKAGIAIVAGFHVEIPGNAGRSYLLPRATDLEVLRKAVEQARNQVDFLMVSFHMHWSGPSRKEVAEGRKIICRAAVDAGADLVVGHGPHILNGVEIHRGKPILHSLGHFYFQTVRDGRSLPQFMQSPAMVNLVETGFDTPEHRMTAIARVIVGSNGVRRLDMLPVTVDVKKDGNPSLAEPTHGTEIVKELQALSAPFGTRIRARDWYTEVEIPS